MLIFCNAALCKDLGCFGPTFLIQEDNLLSYIFERLKALDERGDLQRHNEVIQKKVMDRLHHPDPVRGVSHTKTPRRFTFDPSVVVSQDLTDHKGRIFYKRGTRVNPLHIRNLTHPLLFMDGDEMGHHEWLQKKLIQYPHAKVIFVKGDPFKGIDPDDRPVFYDQGGTLTSKLGIRQVPAQVTQEGDALQIDEERPDV